MSDPEWGDVDLYITYDSKEVRWRYEVPRPCGFKPVVGSTDFQSEARAVVADLVRDKGPARVIQRRAPFGRDGH